MRCIVPCFHVRCPVHPCVNMSCIPRLVTQHQLFKIGALEQQLVCGKGHQEAVEEMRAILQQPGVSDGREGDGMCV